MPDKSAGLKGQSVAIIGGGPAGLIAAEELAANGAIVDVYEAMPTLGRKFLRAGLGGLNITHSEPYQTFCSRYTDKQNLLRPYLDAFTPDRLRSWVHDLGIETFVGTSGRVFPKEMKAAPLLRKWVQRLRNSGVKLHMNHRWNGFEKSNGLRIENLEKEFVINPDAAILALGGASWPQLGSDGSWVPFLQEKGVKIEPWRSANCGFDVEWSTHLKEKFDGEPLKSIAISFTDIDGKTETKEGEMLIKAYGIEGSLIYAFSRKIRDYLEAHGQATFTLDLIPGKSYDRILKDLSRPRGSRSMSRHLQACLGDSAVKRALLYELLNPQQIADPATLAGFLKSFPITVTATRPIAEAISTAGGVSFESVDTNLMLKDLPGIFVAGEMLDWEAPTGGYLLTGCMATGLAAGRGATAWLCDR